MITTEPVMSTEAVMSRRLTRLGLASLALFTIKGLAWIAVAAAGTALAHCRTLPQPAAMEVAMR
jgi:hypothetical protein